MTNRASRRANRAPGPKKPRRGGRRTTASTLVVLLAVFALVLLAIATFGLTAAPAATPAP